MIVDGQPPLANAADSPVRRGAGRRRSFWLPAALVAIGIHAAAFFALGVSSGHREPRQVESRGVRWVGESPDEAIEVSDPKPIFLPTRWNATARNVSATDSRGPGDIFGLEERAPLIDRASSPAGLITEPEGVRTADVAIRRFSRPYFSALGQEDTSVQRLPPRVAGIEVCKATSGEVVLRLDLTGAEATAAGADVKRWPFWSPFEMLLTVEPTGTIGLPLVAAPGSGADVADVVDEFFRENLRTLLRPDLVLPAGYYRVVIGP